MPTRIHNFRQLFVDDYLIHEKRNVYRTVNQPIRLSEPVLKAEKEWEELGVYLYLGTVMYDEEEHLFKMWYSADSKELGQAICFATSRDGLKWDRPNLGICSFNGSKDNNIILSKENAGGEVFIPCVIKRGTKDYVVYYWKGNTPRATGGLFRALSEDGIRWKLTGEQVLYDATGVRGLHANDEALVYYNPRTQEFECYHQVFLAMPPEEIIEFDNVPFWRRVVARNVSRDGVNWGESKIIIAPDENDPPSMQFYGLSAWEYEGMYVGAVLSYPCFKQILYAELVCSRDGEKWIRVDRNMPFLPLGPKGTWDSGMILPTKDLVTVGNELWIYYTGTWSRHCEPYIRETRSQTGLAKLRLDGFASLDCPGEGYVTTRTVVFQDGEKLILNVDSSRGVAFVEILDEWSSPIKGFRREDCDPITVNSVSHTVTWNGSSDLSSLRGKSFRLKIYLKHADLYSFQVV